MSLAVLTALAGAPWEPQVVAALDRPAGPVRVVRRCVDLADLLATAPTGIARAALVSTHLRRLDRDALARLGSAGVVAVGLITPGDAVSADRLRALGVSHVVDADSSGEVIAQVVNDAVRASEVSGSRNWTYADPAAALPAAEPVVHPGEPLAPTGDWVPGQVVAVWGPTGAPGRTTLAVGIAGEAAAAGAPVLLADADVYGGTITQRLGLLGDPPGLPAATRLAATGALDLAAMERLSPAAGPRLRVLAGISRAERWPELRPAALQEVWVMARSLAPLVVVDCGFNLEQDEELSFDVAAPRRNGATLATLESADVVVAVGAGDPVGIARLVRGLAQLHELVPDVTVRVVVNKVRKSAVGPSPDKQVQAALAHYAGVDDITLVPYDLAAADEALLTGRTWAEVAPRSPARLAVARLTAAIRGVPPEPARRRLFRRAAA